MNDIGVRPGNLYLRRRRRGILPGYRLPGRLERQLRRRRVHHNLPSVSAAIASQTFLLESRLRMNHRPRLEPWRGVNHPPRVELCLGMNSRSRLRTGSRTQRQRPAPVLVGRAHGLPYQLDQLQVQRRHEQIDTRFDPHARRPANPGRDSDGDFADVRGTRQDPAKRIFSRPDSASPKDSVYAGC